MTRIDAKVATVVADSTRPVQATLDQHLQIAAARQRTVRQRDDTALVGHEAPDLDDDFPVAVAQVKQIIEAATNRELSFSVDDSGKSLVVRIMTDKGAVLKQIPSEELLKLREQIKEMVGALIDEKA